MADDRKQMTDVNSDRPKFPPVGGCWFEVRGLNTLQLCLKPEAKRPTNLKRPEASPQTTQFNW
jgi:hypothetical protein